MKFKEMGKRRNVFVPNIEMRRASLCPFIDPMIKIGKFGADKIKNRQKIKRKLKKNYPAKIINEFSQLFR